MASMKGGGGGEGHVKNKGDLDNLSLIDTISSSEKGTLYNLTKNIAYFSFLLLSSLGAGEREVFRGKKKLQYVQNAAARLITGIRKHDHITPILMDLHWLPVKERIQFKILLLTFKSLNGLAPVYIDEMIQRYVPNRKLRSSSAFLLKQNKWNLKSYGFRAFTVAAPFLWNSLPLEVKSSPSLNIFKS